jgi:hypothetical protein
MVAALALTLSGCGDPPRAEIPPDVLNAKLAQAGASNRALMATLQRRVITSLESDLAAGRTPSIDLLVLSGGADWGAYGTGFLRAWAERPANDPLAMPEFDVVSGISTGALIAPYAFLGRFAQIDELYRHCSTEWAKSKVISSLFSGEALYDISGLEAVLRREMTEQIAPALRVLTPAQQQRTLAVATGDLDLAILRLWDLQALANDSEKLYSVERAAMAIPAAFEPVMADGTLQADAGVLMQLIAVGHVEGIIEVLEGWNRAHADHPARLRYWVIVNNCTAEYPTTVQPSWHASLLRGTKLMVKAGVTAPLMSLWLQTQVLRGRGLDAEFNWTAIPLDYPADLTRAPFDPRTTNELSDLGKKVAQSATPWQTKMPSFLESGLTGTAPIEPPAKNSTVPTAR